MMARQHYHGGAGRGRQLTSPQNTAVWRESARARVARLGTIATPLGWLASARAVAVSGPLGESSELSVRRCCQDQKCGVTR